jgi:hypothetical protein
VPFIAKTVETINAGGEYPRVTLPTGTAAIANVLKYGATVAITDEAINRIGGFQMSMAGSANLIDNALMSITLTLKAAIDRLAMVALDAAVTNTAATVGLWKTVASSDPVQDVVKARALIRKGLVNVDGVYPGSGFRPDVVIASDLNEAYAHSSASIKTSMASVLSRDVAVTGPEDHLVLAGMELVPTGMLPTATRAFVVDSRQLGFYAYEALHSPEFHGDPAIGIETWARRDPDGNDQWLISGRRPVVPVIANPTAGFMISGLTE